MDKSFFHSDQRVAESDLNFIESSREDAVRQQFAFMLAKFAHLYTGSIDPIAQQSIGDLTPTTGSFRGVGGGLNSDYLTPITGSLSSISISRGWGIDDGMNIVILTGSVTIDQGDNNFNHVWGTLTDGQPAFVTAEYQESSSSVSSDSSGNTFFKRFTGDFLIRVSPTSPSGSNQIVLAQFTADGNLITANTFLDRREFARPWGISDSILDKSPVVSDLLTLFDHTHAVGTGVPVTTNPHGLSLNDLGFTDSLVNHRILEHGNGIVLRDQDSATLLSYSGSVVSPTSNAFISFVPPSNATASINGTLFSGSLASLSAATAPSDGIFFVVANSVGTVSFISTGSITFADNEPVLNSQFLLLGQATIADSGDDITSFIDKRFIYTMSPYETRADFDENTSDPSTSLARTDTIVKSLERIRHTIGIALSGTGSAWPGINPLTSGTGSAGDIYHTHNNIIGSIYNASGSFGGVELLAFIGQSGSIKSLANQFESIHPAVNDGVDNGSRSITTIFTNGDRTRYVSIDFQFTTNSAAITSINAELEASPLLGFGTIFTLAQDKHALTTTNSHINTNNQLKVSGFIPPNWSYRVIISNRTDISSEALETWMEYD